MFFLSDTPGCVRRNEHFVFPLFWQESLPAAGWED